MGKVYICLVFFMISLLSCSMPETRIYTLQLKESPGESIIIDETKSKPVINVHVVSPGHLKQPYIVTRYSDYQVGISKYCKWEASPRDIISNKIKEELESLNMFKDVNSADIDDNEAYLLNVDLKRFELLSFGKEYYGEILIYISFLSPDGKKLYSDRVYNKVKLKSNNFDELAESLSITLNNMLMLIKNEVIKVISN